MTRYQGFWGFGVVNLLLGDDAEALRIFRELADGNTPDERILGRRALVETHMFRGRYEAAREQLETEIADANASGRHAVSILRYQYLAFLYSVLEEHEKALESIAAATSLYDQHLTPGYVWIHEAAVWVACRAGREDLAERSIERLKSIEGIRGEDQGSLAGNVSSAEAILAMKRGEPDIAVRNTRTLLDKWVDTWMLYYHGTALRMAGRFGEAAEYLSKANRYVTGDYLEAFPINILVNYELGLAYEGAGAKEDAVQSYERFLGIWRDAEYTTPEMKDAAKRLAALRADS